MTKYYICDIWNSRKDWRTMLSKQAPIRTRKNQQRTNRGYARTNARIS